MIIPHIIISKRQILYDYISSHYQDLICPPNSTTVQKTCILMKPFEKLWFSKLKYLKVELKGKEIRFFFKNHIQNYYWLARKCVHVSVPIIHSQLLQPADRPLASSSGFEEVIGTEIHTRFMVSLW